MKHRFAVIAILIVVTSSLVVGLVGERLPKRRTTGVRADRFQEEVKEALDTIDRQAVYSPGTEPLLYSAIKKMLHTLDPHSTFFDPKEFARLQEEEHSIYFGLGITVRRLRPDNGRSVVIEPPLTGSPAARAGMLAGDVLTHIEGRPLDALTPEEIKDRLRGVPGSWVSITVERPEVRAPLQFKVERDEIPISTVPFAFEIRPGVGYVKIEKFSETTADELKEKLEKLNAGKLTGMILDLRGNPGGLLAQAIDVADLFLPRGQTIVSTHGRARGANHLYRTVGLKKILVPLVVLINRQSASASEIVAGAFQDHDRAVIVGERSFGKGLVQSVYRLGGGTGMALTTASYFTPSGRQIQRDYSGAMIEYYFQRGGLPKEGQNEKVATTDSGRTVFGGGGITPDIEELVPEANRFESLLTSKLIFFEYARRLTLGQVPAANSFTLPLSRDEVLRTPARSASPRPPMEINDTILEDFRLYLRDRNVDFTPSDISGNIDFIKRGIKQEVYTIVYGQQEGFKIAIQADTQVKRAVEAIPDAGRLMTTGHATPRSPAR
jgi:carboxyl-terminal processing protease